MKAFCRHCVVKGRDTLTTVPSSSLSRSSCPGLKLSSPPDGFMHPQPRRQLVLSVISLGTFSMILPPPLRPRHFPLLYLATDVTNFTDQSFIVFAAYKEEPMMEESWGRREVGEFLVHTLSTWDH